MTKSLSLLEKRLYDTVCHVNTVLTNRQISRYDYLEFMGELQKTMIFASNYMSGCPQGLHSSYCTCTPDKMGWSNRTDADIKKHGRAKTAGHGRWLDHE